MKQLCLSLFSSQVLIINCLFTAMLYLLTFNKFSDILGKTADTAGKVPRVLFDVES